MINGILHVWADMDTSELLGYVYHTEPMIHGIRGKEIDFSILPHGTRYYEIYIPVETKTVNMIRDSLHVYEREDVDELVAPEIKSTYIPPDIANALEDETVANYSGISPSIHDDRGLTDTIPYE